MALSANSSKLTLVAVWDESDASNARGGTAHMVQIARAAGTINFDVIKLKNSAVLPPAAEKVGCRRTLKPRASAALSI